MLARVPYQLHVNAEKYYHSLLLVWLNFLGFKVQNEISTNIGRIDAVWTLADLTVIIEAKYSNERSLEQLLDEASKQIHERKYYEAYLTETNKIILLSIAFSDKEIGCKMETFNK
jgi:Holliday junction resolvase-like predicted endonuclease